MVVSGGWFVVCDWRFVVGGWWFVGGYNLFFKLLTNPYNYFLTINDFSLKIFLCFNKI